MSVRIASTILALSLALAAAPASAGRSAVNDPEARNEGMAAKAGRGLAGMTTSFLELPGNVVAVNRDAGAASAATIGVAKGIGMIPVRTLVGVYEFVTAPVPVPAGYAPILEPRYPWDYFEGSDSASVARR